MGIRLTYGQRQTFRFRNRDVTIRGQLDAAEHPLHRAEYRLNAGPAVPFYVEAVPDDGVDWVNGYKTSPAELRCRELGEFCIEIPVTATELRAGANRVAIAIEDAAGTGHATELTFDWDPTPLPLPLDLTDLSRFRHVQEVGQMVNGAFDLDREQNCIRSRAPVAPDAFLILGSPHTSQEATYAVRFLGLDGAKWLGLADFYVGQEEGVPPRGVKIGWSSAAMAARSASFSWAWG